MTFFNFKQKVCELLVTPFMTSSKARHEQCASNTPSPSEGNETNNNNTNTIDGTIGVIEESYVLVKNLPRTSNPNVTQDIDCFLRQKMGKVLKTSYSCIKCRKRFLCSGCGELRFKFLDCRQSKFKPFTRGLATYVATFIFRKKHPQPPQLKLLLDQMECTLLLTHLFQLMDDQVTPMTVYVPEELPVLLVGMSCQYHLLLCLLLSPLSSPSSQLLMTLSYWFVLDLMLLLPY